MFSLLLKSISVHDLHLAKILKTDIVKNDKEATFYLHYTLCSYLLSPSYFKSNLS